MKLKNLLKVGEKLIKKFPPDAEIWLDDEQVMVVLGEERNSYTIDEILTDNVEVGEVNINWDGISAVRAWNKGGKQRIYFRVVGIPDGAHKSGKVFLELVNGSWMPNMRYPLMAGLAMQLDDIKMFSADDVADAYQDYLESN